MVETVFVVAAHPDDEVLGCGGTIVRHAQSGHQVNVLIAGEGSTSRLKSRDRSQVRHELSTLCHAAQKASSIMGVRKLELLEKLAKSIKKQEKTT